MTNSTINRKPPLVRKLLTPFEEFIRNEAFSGFLLLFAAMAALAWANSPFGASYFALRDLDIHIVFGVYPMHTTLQHFVNDALMALFFFVVGLEIKRELLVGELSSRRKAVLPAVAALGGMLVPALLYTIFNFGFATQRGWAIPMATDIAFALGVMAVLGSRVPISAKIFLTSVAIIDDIGAIVVIAAFYSSGLDFTRIGAAIFVTLVLVLINKGGIRVTWPYMIFGGLLWACLLGSGIHATIAGVIAAATVPVTSKIEAKKFWEIGLLKLNQFAQATRETKTPLIDSKQEKAIHELDSAVHQVQPPMIILQHRFHPVSTFFIMPAFAFFNAGIPIDIATVSISPLSLGILCGLLFGKPVGIAFGCWLAVKMQIAEPLKLTGLQIIGLGSLAGIGFTMAVFMANLAFPDPTMTKNATAAIMLASALAASAGYTILRFAGSDRTR